MRHSKLEEFNNFVLHQLHTVHNFNQQAVAL